MEESKSNKSVVPVIIGIVILLALGVVGYKIMRKSNLQPSSTAMKKETSTLPISPVTKAENVKEITITGSNFKFDMNEIKVKKGETVKLTFKNAEGFHDWNLDELNAHTKKIPAGQEDTITFIANTAGTFEYYCSVGNHRAMGMKGNFIVE